MCIKGGKVVDADTTAITADDKLGYDHIVRLQAIAKTRYIAVFAAMAAQKCITCSYTQWH